MDYRNYRTLPEKLDPVPWGPHEARGNAGLSRFAMEQAISNEKADIPRRTMQLSFS